MKVQVMFQCKRSGAEPYSSEGFHVALESEPPPEVAGDRARLADYVMALAAEARARVEEALEAGRVESTAHESATVPDARTPRGAPNGRTSRRPAASRWEPTRGTARTRPAGDGPIDGHPNGNGSERRDRPVEFSGSGSDVASVKQVNFLRGLAKDAGYSSDQLSFLTEEVTGKRDLRALTKREASQMIDQLRNGPR